MGDKLKIEEIRQIVEMLKDGGVTEFELQREGETIRLSRASSAPVMMYQGPSVVPASGFQNVAAVTEASYPQPAEAPRATKTQDDSFKAVTSPMVGTFYRRSSPDAEPFVQVGDVVRKGQVLCIVEAMKVMNEIESSCSGRVKEACLDDGQMVEFGEVLFRIDPSS
ncbi:MAG: acetyl-CoA carboxylase biotin carboxyl carrier protein [bacterium]|nr:acetyl-CoA carboxylase biotin carboxyl carrier protein [bacterium]